MGDFSRNTFNKLDHYVSVRMQQGVPLIDADWNEQEDIRKYELRTFLKWFVGNGVPKGNDGFHIMPPANNEENDFIIKGGTEDDPGYCLVDGWDVMIEGDINYTGQPLYENESLAIKWNVKKLGPLSPPTDGDQTHLVYLDVWEREVDAYEDEKLINEDIGIETCVRLKREWVVRVAEKLFDEGGLKQYLLAHDIFQPDHVYYPLALLKRTANQNVITDLRHIVAANGQSPTQSAQAADALSITGGTVDGDLFVNGNLGIGTNTPAAKLDVKGDIVSSGKISSQNSRVIASARNIIQSDGSSDWADMPDMAVDITTGNNMLLVLFKAGGLYLEGPSQEPACFRLVVDSQQECHTVHHMYNDEGWDVRDLTFHWMGKVEAGIHNINVQWLQPQGKVITCCKNQDTRSLIAIEL